jgi:TonB family protein
MEEVAMFDYVTTTDTRPAHRRSRLLTGTLSAAAHVAALVALAIPALYATDALPTPPDMLAFVAVSPAPPPPPPPPPPAAAPPERPKRRVKPRPAPRPAVVRPEPVRVAAAAPLEAPQGIQEETGFETTDFSDAVGFEGGIEGGIPGGVAGGIESSPPPPPPPPPAPVRIGGRITPPRLTHRVEPSYPLIAQSARIQGMVILEASVDERGRVTDVRALRSHPVLEGSAIRAVEQWRYQPLVLNGVPTPFILTVTVSFSLGDG